MPYQVGIAPRIRVTWDLFDPNNPTLASTLQGRTPRVLVDAGLVQARRALRSRLDAWTGRHGLAWGEARPGAVGEAMAGHRDLLAVGGATFLAEVRGQADARSVISVPSSTRAQACASGDVLLDRALLTSLSDADWRAGFLEVLRVGLVDDATLVFALETHAPRVVARDLDIAGRLLARSAGTAERPARLGGWFAALAGGSSQALATGIGLDVSYAAELGMLRRSDRDRVLAVLDALGFVPFHPALEDGDALVAAAWREHADRRSLPCLAAIGCGVGARGVCRTTLLAAATSLKSVMLVC